jgi:hypothetical protein
MADDVFRIQDNSDATKEIAFEASGITTGTTRTITMPDSDVTLGTPLSNTVDSAQLVNGSVDIAHLSATGTASSSTILKGNNTWATESTGGPSLGTDHIIRTNALTIAETITFAGTENGMTAGPITISSGVITVTSPSVWTII